MSKSKPFIITIWVNVEDDMEAYNMVESVLVDPRITACCIEPDVDFGTVESVAEDIKRRTIIKRIK